MKFTYPLLGLLVCLCVNSSQAFAASYEEYWELTFFGGHRTSDNIEPDEEDDDDEASIDETEYYEIDFDNAGSGGVILGWNFDYNRTGELLFSHSVTDFDVEFDLADTEVSVSYLHIGGTVTISEGKVPFHIGGGLGVAHLDPSDKTLDSETRISANLGAGVKFLFSDSLSLRLDARGYGTFFDSDSYIFCSGKNGCLIRSSSKLWLQAEFAIGLTYRF
ncbi:outer membrane beta-barrel protein [Thalassotalea sp. Y01]|uniref:outer membrane beta-barrel protein n=1 Tax=Thalassotalea sp. Y01 TaxID=2729613 RepID=UPI00145CDF72|nr:outer membrane beta-barrel protein [Thalassotalea sp. Y01]NMP15162.1 outer membrane beta-barrel protein [Thalassotalea sp. Y01]